MTKTDKEQVKMKNNIIISTKRQHSGGSLVLVQTSIILRNTRIILHLPSFPCDCFYCLAFLLFKRSHAAKYNQCGYPLMRKIISLPKSMLKSSIARKLIKPVID